MSKNNTPRYIPLLDAAHLWDMSIESIERSVKSKEPAFMNTPPVGPQYREVPFSCRKVEGKDRVRRFIGSDEKPDRYRTSIQVGGWKLDNFRRNPSFMWAHGQDPAVPTFPVGKVVLVEPTRTNERGMEDRAAGKTRALAFEVEFYSGEKHPTADLVLDLYDRGFLNAVSVGFQILKARRIKDEDEREALGFGRDEEEAVIIEEQELLELSAVPVPGNPNALIERMRAYSPTAARVFGDVPADAKAWAGKFEELRLALEKERTAPVLTETTTSSNAALTEISLSVAGAEIRVIPEPAVCINSEQPETVNAEPCDECNLAEELGARCSIHDVSARIEIDPGIYRQLADQANRIAKLEAELSDLKADRPVGGSPSAPVPARTYVEEILDEVETFERLHGAFPRLK